jgi:hypothetical protein
LKEYLKFFISASTILLIVALFVLFSPIVFSSFISDKNHYIAATIDKENRLKNVKSPRIIIIGGSGSAYSINSEVIEDSLNLPVINMALAYGLGLDFMLNEVVNNINKNDKIVVVPEYYLPLEGNNKLLSLVNDLNPDAKNYIELNAEDRLRLILVNFQRVGSSIFYNIKNKKDSIATRNTFNANGDVIFHLEKPNTRPLKDQEKLTKKLYNKEINKLNWFAKTIESKGAKMYLSFAAYPITEYAKNKEAINFFESRIKTEVNCKILNKPEDNLYDEAEFFDTVYHLNKTGRSKRANYLIKVLKQAL